MKRYAIFALLCSFPLSSIADEAGVPVTNTTQPVVVHYDPKDLPHEVVERIYPLVPLYAAQVLFPKNDKLLDTPRHKLAGYLVMASTFSGATEVARAVKDFASPTLSALPDGVGAALFFVPAAVNRAFSPDLDDLQSKHNTYTIFLLASATNSAGLAGQALLAGQLDGRVEPGTGKWLIPLGTAATGGALLASQNYLRSPAARSLAFATSQSAMITSIYLERMSMVDMFQWLGATPEQAALATTSSFAAIGSWIMMSGMTGSYAPLGGLIAMEAAGVTGSIYGTEALQKKALPAWLSPTQSNIVACLANIAVGGVSYYFATRVAGNTLKSALQFAAAAPLINAAFMVPGIFKDIGTYLVEKLFSRA